MSSICTPLRLDVLNVTNDLVTDSKVYVSLEPSGENYILTAAASSQFQTDGVVPGDIVFNTEDSSSWASVVSVDSETQLTLDGPFVTVAKGTTTNLKRFCVAAEATAFTVRTANDDRALFWWQTYSVGDRIQNTGGTDKTSFDYNVATIVDIVLEKTEEGEVTGCQLITDAPMYTAARIWLYKEGAVYRTPVDSIVHLEFYLDDEENGSYLALRTTFEGSLELYPYLIEPNNSDGLKVFSDLERRVINAIEEAQRTNSNVLIEDSYGMVLTLS